MASSKGKGPLYQDDDNDPILLPDQADENLIKEYSSSLIGKVLNPKKQNVERLIVAMPEQWGMSDKISACDLGNGRFLFNFDNEEDLTSILNQGPFHHNYCMFVLVRWEPVIDDNYPSMIPFWIQLQGIPLHLCTKQNLEAIGDRLGKLETSDTVEGKIKVSVDSTKPLKFSRKLQTKNKEDIMIKLFYKKLFKHCSTCGLMSQESQDCLHKHDLTQTAPRENVFDRVRPPRQDEASRVNAERGKEETSYRSLNDGSSSTSRVQRSTHSNRVNRINSSRESRYNPYSSVRNKGQEKRFPPRDKEWKEKQRPLRIVEPVRSMDRDTDRASMYPRTTIGDRGKSVVEPDRSQHKRDDTNVTYRGSGSGKSTVDVGTADDLIPPYDALNIDALSEQEQDEEDRICDADMNDIPVGNELMIMEEDDLLGEELNQTENQEPLKQDISQPVFASEHGNSILLIEAKENSGDDGAGDDYAKAITRSATRSLFSSSQAVSRRASTRINAQTTSGHGSGARGQSGHQQGAAVRKSKAVQKKGTVDAKHPPHHRQ
ncbi:uncharacterized protein LOC111206146 [Brassica napus]|uniref:uncharacterized protein LOC111206146 n=1 Tax=Brassica napus TaxID=3708 RepID=UPI002079AFF2|nr:uncharacterized protein LOC111206146 [Brassica napus]